MATAFQASAFQDGAFQIDGGVAPPVDIVIDVDGLRRRDRAAEEFERSRQASKEALRQSIERAFRRANGEVDEQPPLTGPQRLEMARSVQADIRTDGLMANIKDIERLIREYERLLEEERDEEEAVIALLLTH